MEPGGLIGQTLIGRFRIDRVLGKGGMATVYAAFDQKRGCPVAVKILKRELTRDTMVLKRFEREARAASHLNHPNVVEVLDWGVEGDEAFISMELAQGVDLLKALVQERPMRQTRAVLVLAQVCSALSMAHSKGIVHRDLKPENILLVVEPAEPGGERAKVLDFGIAKILDVAKNPGGEETPSYVTKTALTRVGTIVGTPAYMSPEQCRGGEIDGRSDIYACGVLLYQLVTGELPFAGETPLHTAMRHIHARPRPPSELRRDLHPELETIILKALAKWPGERQQTADVFRDELVAVLPKLPDGGNVVLPDNLRPAPREAPVEVAPQEVVSNPTRMAIGGPLGATPLRGVRLGRANDAPATVPTNGQPTPQPTATDPEQRIDDDDEPRTFLMQPETAEQAAISSTDEPRTLTRSENEEWPTLGDAPAVDAPSGPTRAAAATVASAGVARPQLASQTTLDSMQSGVAPRAPLASSTAVAVGAVGKPVEIRTDPMNAAAASPQQRPARAPTNPQQRAPVDRTPSRTERQPIRRTKQTETGLTPTSPHESPSGATAAVITGLEQGRTPIASTARMEESALPTRNSAPRPEPTREVAQPTAPPADNDEDEPATFIREPTASPSPDALGRSEVTQPDPHHEPAQKAPQAKTLVMSESAGAPAAQAPVQVPSRFSPQAAPANTGPNPLYAQPNFGQAVAFAPPAPSAPSGYGQAQADPRALGGGYIQTHNPIAEAEPDADGLRGLKATARMSPEEVERQTTPITSGEPGIKSTVRMNSQETLAKAQAHAQNRQSVPAPPPSIPNFAQLPSSGWNDPTMLTNRREPPKAGLVSSVRDLSGTAALFIGIGLGLGIAAGLLIAFLLLR
ncbi:MAG: protein kinase [Polyangiaceae bacterium]